MVAGGVLDNADIDNDHGIDANSCRGVDCVAPDRELSSRSKGIHRQEDFGIMRMRIGNGFIELANREIEAGKISGVGRILKAAIDGIGQARPRSYR